MNHGTGQQYRWGQSLGGWRLVCLLLSLLLVQGCTRGGHSSAPVRVEVGPPLAWGAGVAKPIRPSKSGYYQVKEADTLLAIAMVHEVEMEELARWNGIRDPDVIFVGQQLRLGPPDGSSPPPPAPVPVATGDTAPGPILAPIGVESTTLSETPPPSSSSLPSPTPAPMAQPTPHAPAMPPPSAQPLAMETTTATTAAIGTAPMAEPTARPLARPEAAGEEGGKGGSEVAKSADYSGILKAPSPKGWRWPVRGKITQKFGQFGQHRFNGIDIAVHEGTPVEAAAAGIVAYADDGLSSYGNLILIRHGGSYMSAYAHNAAILVKPGQKVAAGQVIAKAGRTGSTPTAKLHFELRQGIQPVDPLQFLPKPN